MKLKVGDIVIRQIGPDDKNIKMDMQIMHIEHGLIYCLAVDGPKITNKDDMWRFEQLTGAEYDPDLKWGSEWGGTGSRLIGLKEVQ